MSDDYFDLYQAAKRRVFALEAQNQQLSEALMSALAVFDSMDVYRRYVPVRDLMSAALAATEPKEKA